MLLITSDQFILTVAVTSLLLYLIKVAFLFFGDSGSIETSDATDIFDADFHDAATQASFSLFSFQSILAFLMGSSWALLTFRHSFYFSEGLSWFGALSFGFMMMVLSAYLLSRMHRLSSESQFDITKAVGQAGQVYLPIPPKGQGFGQVEIIVAGRKKIVKASNNDDETIESFTKVVVVRVENRSLIVKRN